MNKNRPYIFKCASCGSHKVFSPKDQALLCPQCGSVSEFEISNKVYKKPLSQAEEHTAVFHSETDNDIDILTCSSCGAALNMLKGEIAGKCPFCGTGNIILKENIQGLKPDECVPFTIEPQQAEQSFKKWIKKRWFAPSELKKTARAEQLKGIYSPCYAFDTKSRSTYKGVLGKTYVTYVGSGKNRRAVTKIKYFPISGNLDKNFYDVMAECSPHFDQKVLDRIRPFALEKRAVYDKAFLSGFSADSNDISLSQGWQNAKIVLDNDIRRAILSKYNHDVVQSLTVSTVYDDLKYSYMLLPIYLSGYKYKQKIYSFFVNGNTGRTFGKFPLSPLKVFFALLGIAALIAAAILIYKFYFAPEAELLAKTFLRH